MEQIGEILRRLRTERGFTQTEVASAISVTSQAVSKWENGTGLPDVSQLVPLADFFGVTVDCILGRRDNAAEEEITEFIATHNDIESFIRDYTDAHNCSKHDSILTFVKECRTIRRKYPNNFPLMDTACYALSVAPVIGGFDNTPEAYAMYEELIALNEKILAESTDGVSRRNAIISLKLHYFYQNRYDKVRELAETLPDLDGCREAVLCHGSKPGTEEQLTYEEEFLHRMMGEVHYLLTRYRCHDCPPEERLALADMEWRIYHAYYDHNDFDGWRACTLFENRLYAARAYLALDNTDAAEEVIQAGFNLLVSVIADESAPYISTAMTRLGDKITWSRNDKYPDWVRDMSKQFTKDTGMDITHRLEAVLTTA